MNADLYKHNLAEALRRHVGRGGTYRVEDFADETGIAPRRIYAMRDEQGVPTLPEIIVMAKALPADFLSEVMRPAGVTSVAKGFEISATTSGAHTLTRLTQEASNLAKALEDGRIDHRERAELVPALQTLRGDIDAFLAGLNSENVETFPRAEGNG